LSQQHTIEREAELSGRGLFTGFPVTARFKPAPPGTGILFVRTDQAEPVTIPARLDNLSKRARRTSLRNGTAAIETIEHCLAAARADARDDLVRLAVRIAERILGRELQLSPDAVADVAAAALAEAPGARRLLVRAHPDDLPALERARERLAAAVPDGELAFGGDPAIARGGCVIDAGGGEIDARLATQLAALERALTS
jgi:flagellar biosynthesis/type III secretory pathway protein FliH